MEELAGPYEILELDDGGQIDLQIEKFETGAVKIHPSYAPQGKLIKVLRVWVKDGTKEHFPPYWDITSQFLVAQLEPLLQAPDSRNWTYRVTKHGVAPKARFSVEVR